MKANRLVWMLLLLLLGNGCKDKSVSSITVIRAKAEKGDAVAQYNLGRCYAKGQGVATNEVEAVKWCRKAAEQNYRAAQYSLSVCYADGRGVAKDEAEAVKWYGKAAESGDVNALNALARMLATSENWDIRDASNAVVFAEKAVAATNRKNPANLDTLAAAYANMGYFENAVSIEQEAIALLRTEADKNDYKTRLGLYYVDLPYRAKN